MRRRIFMAFFVVGALVLIPEGISAQAPDGAAEALQKAKAELAAAEKATAAAVQAQVVAKKALAQAATANDAAAKATAAKELAQKTAAVKVAQAKVKAARLTLLAEQAWAARDAVKEVEKAKAAAEKKLAAEKTPEGKAAAQKALAAKSAALIQAQDAAALAHAQALGGLKPITTAQWDYAKARHLLFRAGFGGTPEEVERMVKMGPYKAVDYLVEFHNRPTANNELAIRTWERPLAYENRLHQNARGWLAEREVLRDNTQHAVLFRWWLQRMVETPRPLEEKLGLFWHDHFATAYLALRDAYLMHQQNQLFRRHADNFEALLHGIVQDPAMIRYLNNDENVKGNNNENFGRELLELFSMGEENSAAHKGDGYTEKDVRDGNTRALTGFTFDKWSGQFRFYQSRHDTTPKKLLGKTGNLGAHEAVDIMLQHPATARYVAKKLCQYFAVWEPEPATVEQLAHVLRENNYAIRPLLKNLFLSEWFYSDKALASHIKSPVELLVSTARNLKLTKINYETWRAACTNMGQALFDPPSVAGWPEGQDWINANLLLVRYNVAANLVQQNKVDFVALLQKRTLNTPAEVVDYLAQRFLLTKLNEEKRQALVQFAGQLPPSTEWAKTRDQVNAKLRALVVLLMSTPEYQVS